MNVYNYNSDSFNNAFENYVQTESVLQTPIIQVAAYNITWECGVDVGKLRNDEMDIAVGDDLSNIIAIHDLRYVTKLQAGLGIGQTLFVCFVLASGAMLFTKEANDLVIIPIEQMIAKVNRIAANPLLAAQEEENEALLQEK